MSVMPFSPVSRKKIKENRKTGHFDSDSSGYKISEFWQTLGAEGCSLSHVLRFARKNSAKSVNPGFFSK
jgi:hypothetical protein